MITDKDHVVQLMRRVIDYIEAIIEGADDQTCRRLKPPNAIEYQRALWKVTLMLVTRDGLWEARFDLKNRTTQPRSLTSSFPSSKSRRNEHPDPAPPLDSRARRPPSRRSASREPSMTSTNGVRLCHARTPNDGGGGRVTDLRKGRKRPYAARPAGSKISAMRQRHRDGNVIGCGVERTSAQDQERGRGVIMDEPIAEGFELVKYITAPRLCAGKSRRRSRGSDPSRPCIEWLLSGRTSRGRLRRRR
jgi:hypothetical protein